MKRRPASKGSKKTFRRTAAKTHVKNIAPPPTRGGYRL